jgi:hypothetical protein
MIEGSQSRHSRAAASPECSLDRLLGSAIGVVAVDLEEIHSLIVC